VGLVGETVRPGDGDMIGVGGLLGCLRCLETSCQRSCCKGSTTAGAGHETGAGGPDGVAGLWALPFEGSLWWSDGAESLCSMRSRRSAMRSKSDLSSTEAGGTGSGGVVGSGWDAGAAVAVVAWTKAWSSCHGSLSAGSLPALALSGMVARISERYVANSCLSCASASFLSSARRLV
jgi:hypothetical protein